MTETNYIRFGASVALDDSILVVGATHDGTEFFGTGAAYVFRETDGNWEQEGRLTSFDSAEGDLIGCDVAVDGDTIVVGAAYHDEKGLNSGAAYVFREIEGAWRQIAKLTASDGSFNDQFGFKIAISNDSVVVGALFAGTNGSETGAAYVFQEIDGTWQQVTKLLAIDSVDGDLFGSSVAIEDDTILVAADGAHANGIGNSGKIYMYRKFGGEWRLVNQFSPMDGGYFEYFGNQVALDGNLALVSANFDDDNGNMAGSAYLLNIPASTDCDLNGTPDSCDVSEGVALDCNGNGLPDDCDPDCNANQIPDDCDTLIGTSADCNTNTVPDECEEDCNGNGFPDACDIAQLTSNDCNVNGVPDECDLASGSSADCDGNSIPDDCEQDCNGNNVLDLCDIANGVAVDCNGNGVPDSCEPDCNENGIADTCDIASGFSEDCNADSIPDECNLRAGQIEKIFPSLLVNDDRFGSAVAIDGNTAIVGAIGDDYVNSNAGAGYAFTRTAVGWEQVAKFNPIDLTSQSMFGASVAVSGPFALIGAPQFSGLGNNRGAAYLFENQQGFWRSIGRLIADDGFAGDQFGCAVAIDGGNALIGAVGEDYLDIPAGQVGTAYIYVHSDGSWLQSEKLIPSDLYSNLSFGSSVAIHGDTCVIGATGGNGNELSTGSAFVFRFSNGGWQQIARLIADDGIINSRFGTSVDIDGDSIVVGAPLANGDVFRSGAAYVYREINGAWQQVGKLTSTAGIPYQQFGQSVSIDNGVAVVGSHLHNFYQGSTFVFREFNGHWLLTDSVHASDGVQGDQFGFAVALDGDQFLVGANREMPFFSARSGAAYFFDLPTDSDCNANAVPDLCDIAEGISQDCNQNGVSDACERDCDDNGIPDECELDADGDSIPDGCDPCPQTPFGVLQLDYDDLSMFVTALIDANSLTNEERCAADVNFDSVVDGSDIQSFIDAVLTP